ncbi:hypothetical protein [Curtobacterium sp. VKM Ac-1393]|uniref:hypothetical protein n=1 Tax=Curtobacterium sp. VKM Ac-1393 TaxID=2783814 RepID=UPI001889D696|nr:hypothetical protein [Curtobacterium sp. VKM Ac-1393]MBF4607281.1 hypothetical protein [Curtobacterium sp. VKM Ac-1393]
MASHQNRNLNERRREMQIVLDWLDLNGRGVGELYDHLLAGPGDKRQFRALYRVEPFLDEPDVFAFQIAIIRKLRTDADFRRCAEQHFLIQYDRDEAAATAQAGLDDDCAELHRQHWGDDPNAIDAGRRLLSLLFSITGTTSSATRSTTTLDGLPTPPTTWHGACRGSASGSTSGEAAQRSG